MKTATNINQGTSIVNNTSDHSKNLRRMRKSTQTRKNSAGPDFEVLLKLVVQLFKKWISSSLKKWKMNSTVPILLLLLFGWGALASPSNLYALQGTPLFFLFILFRSSSSLSSIPYESWQKKRSSFKTVSSYVTLSLLVLL